MAAGRDGGEDVGEAGDQGFAVGLVDAVLHGEVDEFGVGRRLAEGGGEEGDALQVEDDVGARVAGRQDGAGPRGGDLEVGDHGDAFDLRGPAEADVVADVEGGFGRAEAGVDAAGGGGENFAEGDFEPRGGGGVEGVEVGADEAAVEGGGDVVGMTLYLHRFEPKY